MADPGDLSPGAAGIAAIVAARLPSNPIVVALSGGADSAVLAWAIRQHTDHVRAVSIDQRQRASSRLMAAAAAIAARLDLELEVVTAEESAATETALRSTRYAALERAVGIDEIIATGHTLDDQAETVLGNAIRGAGTLGLRGIPRSGRGLIRPLLDVTRQAVRDVAIELGLPFLDDPQNDDPTIRRNRLRHETMPHLAEFNPGVVAALGRLASHASVDDELLQMRADRVPVRVQDGAVAVPAASIAMLPLPIASRVIRRALSLAGVPYPGSSADVRAALGAVAGPPVTVGGGVQVEREGPWLVLFSEGPGVPSPVVLDRGSEVRFDDWVVAAGPETAAIGRYAASIAVSDQMIVRSAGADERIAIGSGSKRVGVAMAEAGVPARLRARWPTLVVAGSVVWIPGVRVAPVRSGDAVITVRAMRQR